MLIDFRKLFPKYNIKPKGVLHVGANVGEEAPVYDELGIKNVCWIEANPNLIGKLIHNVHPLGHRTYNFAASDEDGNALLHESNNAGQSSSLLQLGTHSIAHPEVYYIADIPVQTIRLDSFNDEFIGLDFLNIDVQGAELKVLKGMGDLLKQFKWAYLEVNKEYLYEGCPLVEDLDIYLLGFGFKRVETKWCGNTGWGDGLWVKKQ